MTNSSNETLERIARRIPVPEPAHERMLRRRDRRRRNPRIAAGVVGLALFVATVPAVGTLGLSDGTQGPAGGAETGPTATGPAETGPTTSGPYGFDPDADYVGLPPEGSRPGGAEASELIAETHAIFIGWVYVFEDGRVISASLGTPSSSEPAGIREQRLTPEGVELVRSGVISPDDFICVEKSNLASFDCESPLHEVPASAWEDSTLRPYVPYRYAICGLGLAGPPAADNLLRGKQRSFDVVWSRSGTECFDVTTEEARALDEILAEGGFEVGTPGIASYERWLGIDDFDPELNVSFEEPEVVVSFEPILPHGTFGSQGGG